ncbi:uncharacterized protein LOC110448639 [Mizuhopecten yessoensis]|uniref:Uncharacterized protein n=1 Tax=Mizuhopecten yessoensis TaxID=6573 RepID=A0A210QSZ0_MIZYE|nr:uncharacterized protein LOC110448639 [Mizuhopecten yessoensis]OWF51829.1 hypothetical protein KP79_PYT05639 [Mizuhopecten yessoensis]
MLLTSSILLVLLNIIFCSAEILENKRKADELDLIVSIAFHEKIVREAPALKELVEKQAVECEAKLNLTFKACESCRARYEIIPQPNKGGLDQLLLQILPTSLGGLALGGVTGKPLGTLVEKTIPSVVKDVGSNLETFFKGTIPRVGKDIKKQLGKFFTKTLPGTGKTVVSHLETFFKKTIPKTGKNVGGHLDTFFTESIPKVGKDVGGHLETFFKKTLPSTGKDVGNHLHTFFKKSMPKAGKKVKHFFTNAIPEAGKEVKHFFKNTIPGLFNGRRRRQASQCPDCDKINTDTMTSSDVTRTVCGQAYVNNVAQYRKMAIINQLIHVDKKPVITKVTFMRKDAVNKLLEGVASASPFAVTYTDGTTSEILKSDSTLDLLNPNQALGEELAKEIWDMI